MVIELYSEQGLEFREKIELGIIGIMDFECSNCSSTKEKCLRFTFNFLTPERTFATLTYYTKNGYTINDLSIINKVRIKTNNLTFINSGFYKRSKTKLDITGFVSE